MGAALRAMMLLCLPLLLTLCTAAPTTVNIVDTTVTVNGTVYKRFGFSGKGPNWFTQNRISGLRFDASKGEDFDVIYVNQINEDTVVHQHGLTPPHYLDGVPYMSTKPLAPNQTLHSKFALENNERSNVGTYFMHSHYGFQHEMGV